MSDKIKPNIKKTMVIENIVILYYIIIQPFSCCLWFFLRLNVVILSFQCLDSPSRLLNDIRITGSGVLLDLSTGFSDAMVLTLDNPFRECTRSGCKN